MDDRTFGKFFAVTLLFVLAAWAGIGYAIYRILTHFGIV
jgi:hypothetical protein